MGFEGLKARFFEALDREDGGITAAARAIGVNRNTAFGWARQAGVRGRGRPRRPGHPGRAEYERLRAAGVRRRDAAAQAGVHERTAEDWDRGIRQIGHSRLHPNGRRIDYGSAVRGRRARITARQARPAARRDRRVEGWRMVSLLPIAGVWLPPAHMAFQRRAGGFLLRRTERWPLPVVV